MWLDTLLSAVLAKVLLFVRRNAVPLPLASAAFCDPSGLCTQKGELRFMDGGHFPPDVGNSLWVPFQKLPSISHLLSYSKQESPVCVETILAVMPCPSLLVRSSSGPKWPVWIPVLPAWTVERTHLAQSLPTF